MSWSWLSFSAGIIGTLLFLGAIGGAVGLWLDRRIDDARMRAVAMCHTSNSDMAPSVASDKAGRCGLTFAVTAG